MSRPGERLRALVTRVDALSERLGRVEQGLVEDRWRHARNLSPASGQQEPCSADELELVRLGAEADQWREECAAALERYEEMRDAYLRMAARAGRLQSELLAVAREAAPPAREGAASGLASESCDEAGEPLRDQEQ